MLTIIGNYIDNKGFPEKHRLKLESKWKTPWREMKAIYAVCLIVFLKDENSAKQINKHTQ